MTTDDRTSTSEGRPPTPPTRPVAAVVGTGFMGAAHTEALRRLGVPVKGIVGSSPERARAKAAAAHLPAPFDSLDALLADPEVEVVHITTPNHLHHAQVAAVLDAGKHVVCEKPLAVSVGEARDLAERAAAGDRVHAVCFNQRYYPMVQQARAMVAAGELGEVRLVTGGYLQDWLLYDTDWNWRLVPEKSGELRAVADIGSHWFDNVEFITGTRLSAVTAELHTFHRSRTHPVGEVESFSAHTVGDAEARVTEAIASDDAAGALLRFANGARGTCTVSQVSPGRKNLLNWEIDGTDGALAWNTESPDDLWIGHRGRPNELLKRDPGLLHPAAAATAAYPGGHVEGYASTFRALFADVYADVEARRAGAPVVVPRYPTFADGLRSLVVCDAVARSARAQAWADVIDAGS